MIGFLIYILGVLVTSLVTAFWWMYTENTEKIESEGVLFCALVGSVWFMAWALITAFIIGKITAMIAERYYPTVCIKLERVRLWLRKT